MWIAGKILKGTLGWLGSISRMEFIMAKTFYPLNERFIEPEMRLRSRVWWLEDELSKVQAEGYYESSVGEIRAIKAELKRLRKEMR
jgi:hypothetical protein